MKLGVGIPAKSTDQYRIPPRRAVDFVRRAEKAGFSSAWALEHLTVPDSYRTSFQDPLTTLAMVAGATETIEIGTSILILPMRHPVMVAKRAATIQHFSEGRLTLGLGQGYSEEEYGAVGVPYRERHRRFTEGLQLLSRLLHEEAVTFDGEFYQVEDMTIEPTLTRAPRLLCAGGGRERDGEWDVARTVKERIAGVDGWIASSSAAIEKDWGEIAPYLEANGTDPERVERVALQHIHVVPGEGEQVRAEQRKVFADFLTEKRGVGWAEEYFLFGTVEEILERLERYRDAGTDEVILHPAAHRPSDLDRQLDLWTEHLLPAFS